MRRPCLTCGVLSDNSRCEEHAVTYEREQHRRHPHSDEHKARDADLYNAAWTRLSRRARALQTWCSDCGTSDDLTTDHLPEAHAAKAAGRTITLRMVDVVCRSCNGKRGTSKPGSARANA